ncbi:hypothetical protein L1887_49197 [Cichorium endivia]|nr:hypothetical protein L1887_49197 [Cichorium endivia]
MRGQAFVALDSVEAADKARREAHLFPLYGKAMKISFAKSKSDAVVAQETAESGGKESDDFQKHKEQRLEHKKMARRGNVLRRRELEKKIRAKRAAAGEIAEPEKASGAAAKRAQHDMPDESPLQEHRLQQHSQLLGHMSDPHLHGADPCILAMSRVVVIIIQRKHSLPAHVRVYECRRVSKSSEAGI